MLGRLRAGTAPSLAGGRYFLLEPPHTVAPPRFSEAMFDFVAAGYVPVLTHPERLTWIRPHYAAFVALVKSGVWMQVTAGSLTGRFGKDARYFGEKMLDDGLVHLLATDAHSVRHRAPLLAEGREAAAKRVGAEEAQRLVVDRPQAILDNRRPAEVAPVPALRDGGATPRRRGFLGRFLGRARSLAALTADLPPRARDFVPAGRRSRPGFRGGREIAWLNHRIHGAPEIGARTLAGPSGPGPAKTMQDLVPLRIIEIDDGPDPARVSRRRRTPRPAGRDGGRPTAHARQPAPLGLDAVR